MLTNGLPELEEELNLPLRERSDLQVVTRENAEIASDALGAINEVSPTDRTVPTTPATQPDLLDAALPKSSPVPIEEPGERRLSVQSLDARNVASPLRIERFEDAVATVVLSPDPSTPWRLSEDTVEHTVDAGVTWRLQLAGISKMQSWEQVRARTETDVVAVEAMDEQSATVDGMDATSFRTQDDGQSWTQTYAAPR